MDDPQKGVDTLVAGTKDEIDETVDRPGADLLVPLWKPQSGAFGNQDIARWENFTKWMQDVGLLSTELEATDAFVNVEK